MKPMTIEKAFELGYSLPRIFADGTCAGLMPQIYTVGLFVNITEKNNGGCYHYERFTDAAVALAEWNGVGDPPGPWIKRKVDGKEDVTGPGYKPAGAS